MLKTKFCAIKANTFVIALYILRSRIYANTWFGHDIDLYKGCEIYDASIT